MNAPLLLLVLSCFVVHGSARYLRLVVGGDNVTRAGTYPWQVSLQMRSGNRHICGGSILSARWILTAAHCVGAGPLRLQVVLGLHDRTTLKQGSPKAYRISKIIKHPDYVSSGIKGFPNDVALIRLTRPAKFNTFVKPITLASPESPNFVGKRCYITGWGRLYGEGPLPNVLQEARVDILTEKECRMFWGKIISDVHICLGDRTAARKAACNGDSGGPLVCMVNSEFQLAGVTSWGRTGCSTTSASVYARVATFRSWIAEVTGV